MSIIAWRRGQFGQVDFQAGVVGGVGLVSARQR